MEAHIEEFLLNKLTDLKYTYRQDIKDKNTLELNFRRKFEHYNQIQLTDNEFERLKTEIFTPDVFQNSKRLRQTNTFQRDDGTTLHYTLLNTKDWCKNDFEVVSQLRMNTSNTYQRYDVIILMNGIPVVQIELKSYNISPRKAIEQILNYKQTDGTGYNNSLLCFIQLFIVSNHANTWYFANNNPEHFKFNAQEQYLPVYQWADENNRKITHLEDFSHKFLSKCHLAEIISRYMVLVETERKILAMRPYQIYAVKAITNAIHENRGNGYIWHTTGSGKTLTSFKASVLMKENPEVYKCLFVVDRKDLDRQTRDEFNRFQPNCVEQNTNTQMLVQRLLSQNYADKVIVTTIQKLGIALDANNPYKERLKPLKDKRIVFIFDECHRSQFGENHKAIKEFFPKAQLFGFTGTPIFEQNASRKKIQGTKASAFTTKDIFQNLLHSYTITHAIEDKNVLRFHIDYFTHNPSTDFNSPQHKTAVVQAILQKHNAATAQRKFNAIFATASINDAIEYYQLFQQIQQQHKEQNPDFIPLNIACIFSPPSYISEDIKQLQEDLPQENQDLQTDPEGKKNALIQIMQHYNQQYKTHFSIYDFDAYYQDIQKRIKDQQYPNSQYPHAQKIDITIVVDMLLTGFDSKYLNTLYVDKYLKYHSLIQAFSRTNRVLNDSKPYGNILDFRGQKNEVDQAILLFSGENPQPEDKQIWLVEPADKVIRKYQDALQAMKQTFTQCHLAAEPQQVYNLKGDAAKIQFMDTFKEVQRLKIQLDQYTDLTPKQKNFIDSLLPAQTFLSFKAAYLETARNFKKSTSPKDIEQIPDFELHLFASALIDYDYIMKLIAQYTQQKPTQKIKLTREQLLQLLASSANLMDEAQDLTEFINQIPQKVPFTEDQIKQEYQNFKQQKITLQLQNISTQFQISLQNLQNFVQNIITRNIFDATQLTKLFEHLQLGWKERKKLEEQFMQNLIPILKKMANGKTITGLNAYED